MLIFRLSQELEAQEQEEWKNLEMQNLGNEVHPDRALSYCLAREALRSCLRASGLEVKIAELQLIDYNRIKVTDSFTLSLSHTKKWGAAVTAPAGSYLGLGIDIESKSREIKSAVLNRIRHVNDHDLPPLQAWCLKEAIFKTLMNAQKIHHPVEFSSIQINEQGWIHLDSGSTGDYQMVTHPELEIALSWIKI